MPDIILSVLNFNQSRKVEERERASLISVTSGKLVLIWETDLLLYAENLMLVVY